MITIIEENNKELTPEKLGEAIDYLRIESIAYRSVDGENRIETPLKKIVS